MSADAIGSAIVFLAVVALVVAVGVVVGIIAAGRIDRLMAPRPARATDDPAQPPAPSSDEEEQS